MRFITNGGTDPAYNLAAEEYFLEKARCDPERGVTVMLWQNDPAVIIGRNQNAYAELDLAYVREHHIAVVRRLTGGGAVYHDGGNVCFTFIAPKTSSGIDFRPFTEPVIKALCDMGIEASLGGRNDITVTHDGCEYKISGNAQCNVQYNVPCSIGGEPPAQLVLSHGTLLFAADLEVLGHALRPDPDKLAAKGISSVRSRVMNLCGLLPDMTCGMFLSRLSAAFSERYGEPTRHTQEEYAAIATLAREKYSSWEWNFGASRQFSVMRKKRYPFGGVSVGLECDRGVITDVCISGDFFGEDDICGLEQKLRGVPFEHDALYNAVEKMTPPVDRYIAGMDPQSFVCLLCK